MIKAELYFKNVDESDYFWDLAEVTTRITHTSKRRGSPTKVELDVITDINIELGGNLAIVLDGIEFFYGRLFRKKVKKRNQVTLIFYDQLQYMMRENTFIFRESTLSGVIETIAKDFELEVGELNGPTEQLPTTLMENKKALDIVEECITQILINTGKLYTIWDDFGKLRLDEHKNMRIMTMLADGSIISDYEYDTNIEDSANVIKLVHDNKDTGKREVYIYKDSDNVERWGHLQHLEMMKEGATEGQIKQIGEMLLELKNRSQDSVSLEFSIGDLEFIAGRAVYVEVKEVNLDGWYILDEVQHEITAGGHSMSCKLWMGEANT